MLRSLPTASELRLTNSISVGLRVPARGIVTRGDLDAGPHQRWATGTLWEQLTLRGKYDDYNQWNLGSGHGWAGAYNVLWNSTVDEIQVESPPGAYNWVIGCKGRHVNPQLGTSDAYYQSPGVAVEPASLYQEQLKERLARSEHAASR